MAPPEYDALDVRAQTTVATTVSRSWVKDLVILLTGAVAVAAVTFLGTAVVLYVLLVATVLAPLAALAIAIVVAREARAERRAAA